MTLKNGGVFMDKKELGRRIFAERKKRGWSQAELGQKVGGLTRGAVSNWEKGKSAPDPIDHAARVANLLNLPLNLFLGDPSWANVAAPSDETKSRWVPKISWVQAGKGAAAVDPYPTGIGVDYVRVPARFSDETFALEIRGASMEPKFQEGDTIIIDPSKRISLKAGDYVIAELLPNGLTEGHGTVTFKQYYPRKSPSGAITAFDLVPLNPDEDTVTVNRQNPGRIIGKMVQHTKNYD